ncbi:hypothetical protein C8Q80DRAFT_1270523 [Daedaleopsis nitida]|nr:hypothetical protein C8Q80DRAFT_1270523 [Daedaleopsis nitida]
MSHLLAPQEEKKTTREEKSGQTFKATGQSWLVPPQEEKADVAALRGEQARLDQAVGRIEDRINQRRIEREGGTSIDELAQDKQQRDAVLSGAAGVTGEDFGIAEKHRVVRS